MGQGGGWISGDKKVPSGGAFLPSCSPSVGLRGNMIIKFKGERSDEQNCIVFLWA